MENALGLEEGKVECFEMGSKANERPSAEASVGE